MTEAAHLEDIFRAWDKNQDGCLDRSEFAGLIKAVNPEVPLSDDQLGLILEEVWASFPRHINTKGLTLSGLKQLYAEGLADLDHDYNTLKNSSTAPDSPEAMDIVQRESSCDSKSGAKTVAVAVAAAVAGSAATAAALVSGPTKVPTKAERVEAGKAAQAARAPRQPALADLSPPAAINQEASSPNGDVFAAIQTPAPKAVASPGDEADIFANLKTPAVVAATIQNTHSPVVIEEPESINPGLAFCLMLEDLSCVNELRCSMKDQELLACLRQALPDGDCAISYVLPTALGLAIGVACKLPQASVASEDFQYTTTVLQHEPDQIFPSASFGHAEVVMAAPSAVVGNIDEAAKAATYATAALAIAGTVSKVPLAFTLRLPQVWTQEAFMGQNAAQFMLALEGALPVGSSAHITATSALPSNLGLSVSVALSLPSQQQAQTLHRKLVSDVTAALPGVAACPAGRGCKLVAVASPGRPRPTLAAKLIFPGVKEAAFWGSLELDLIEAVEEALPDGCTAAIAHAVPAKDGLHVTTVVALPVGTSVKESQRCVSRLQQPQKWAAAITGVKKVECSAAGDALQVGLSPEAEALAASIEAITRPAGTAPSPAELSPNKSGLFSRMFSKKKTGLSPEKVAAAAVVVAEIDAKKKGKAGVGVLPDSPLAGDAMSATDGNTPVHQGTNNRTPGTTAATAAAAAAGLAVAVGGLSLADDAEIESRPASPSKSPGPRIPAVMPEDLAAMRSSEKPPLGKDGSGGVPIVDVHAYALTDEESGSLPSRHPSAASSRAASQAGGSPTRKAALGLMDRGPSADSEIMPEPTEDGGHDTNKRDSSPSKARGLFSSFKKSPSRAALAVEQRAEKGGAKRPAGLTSLQLPTDEDLLDQVETTPTNRSLGRPSPGDVDGFGGPSGSSDQDSMDARVKFLVAELERILHDPNCGTNDVGFLQDAVGRIKADWARHSAHMEIGERLSQRKLYPEALKSFKEASAANPSDPLAHFRLANTYFAMRHYPSASKEYAAASACCKPGQDDTLSTKILVNHGITQESMDSLTNAVHLYELAVAASPDHPRAFKLMGSAKYALGDFEGAKAALRQALKIKPDFAEAYGDLGCAYIALGDVDNANRCLRQAIKLKPDLVEAHFNLGNLLRQCHDFEKAIECYDAVLALDPAHWRSLLNRAVVLICLGDNDRAAADIQRATRLSGHLSAGSLTTEVDQLRRMLRSNADWTSVSQMMSYIEDRARQIESGVVGASPHAMSFSGMSGNSAASGSMQYNGGYQVHTGGIAESLLRRLPGHEAYDGASRGSRSVRSFGARSMRSVKSGGGYSARSGAPSVRQGFSPRRVPRTPGPPLSPNRSPEKLRNWEPPVYVSANDISPEVVTRLESMKFEDVPKLLETLDVPLMQSLQPCSSVSLAEIWIEVQESGEILSRSKSRRGAKMLRLSNAELVLRRLLARAPATLFQHTMRALQGQVLALLDYNQTGYVDLTMLLCVLASVSDQTLRDRLDLTYKLLMWRNSASADEENPITRKDLIELMATLKMVFERTHKTNYLADRKLSAVDSQYIIFGRFQSDLLKFFPHYEVLPMLCNPLS